MAEKKVCVLGATGSIGQSTLDVIARHPERYKVYALTANQNIERLCEQAIRFQPECLVVSKEEDAELLRSRLDGKGLSEIRVLCGKESLCEVAGADEVDYVMAAIVGAAGLLPTLAAIKVGKRVLLANKEALVMSGQLFMGEVNRSGAELIPIDSEHNAVFQCMPRDYEVGQRSKQINSILLTASGGPFRNLPLEKFGGITPEQACSHPNWEMGRKISVDSATMMNKGLELIEASWLFNVPASQLKVVIHPQSVIHSLVEYVDGSVLAQMGNPDMRIPIAHAMAWPDRVESGVEPLDLFKVQQLDFEAPDLDRFPCLRLALEALEAGGGMPAVLNAANEVSVQSFLDNRIRFSEIAIVNEAVMNSLEERNIDSLEQILAVDSAARALAEEKIASIN